jgi:hypothetical protein
VGVSIHYSGRIREDRIAPLCEELCDIAGSISWTFQDIDDAEKGLHGIILSPASGMEPVPFLFDTKGRLHSLADLIVGWNTGDFLCVAVKTQFAGCAEHVWLCGLLRHIQRAYMPGLKVVDEGGFWEGGSQLELQKRMDFLDRMIAEFGAALEQASMDVVIDKSDANAVADFVERVAERFRREKREGE